MLFILSLVRHHSQVIYFIERCIYRINAVCWPGCLFYVASKPSYLWLWNINSPLDVALYSLLPPTAMGTLRKINHTVESQRNKSHFV